MLRSIGKQSGSPWSQSWRRREGFEEKEGFKPGVKERGSDGWWEWWVDYRGSAISYWDRWVGNLEETRVNHEIIRWIISCYGATCDWKKCGKRKLRHRIAFSFPAFPPQQFFSIVLFSRFQRSRNVMLFRCHQRIYQITRWILRRASLKFSH